MVFGSLFEFPRCNYVHSYSISPCLTPFWNMSLAVDCPRTEIKTVCTQGTSDHLRARVNILDLVFRHGYHAQILAWAFGKKKLFTLVQVLYSSQYWKKLQHVFASSSLGCCWFHSAKTIHNHFLFITILIFTFFKNLKFWDFVCFVK